MPGGMQYHAQHTPRSQAGGDVVVKRVMPRQNEEVNEIWLCDKGRFAYHYTESKNASPSRWSARKKNLPALRGITQKAAAENFTANKKDFVVLASGRLANEDLFNLKSLADTAAVQPFCTPIWAAVS
jgi:NADH-quinone oxidoreductase subunit G